MDSPSLLEKERIVSVDIIRGFALIGIFLVNLPTMHSPVFIQGQLGMPPVYEGADRVLRILLDLFVQAKFYTIFSFLFGFGFYIFMSRAEARRTPGKRLFARRLLALLVFGLLHMILFWSGDILSTYAVAGFLLLPFFHRKPATIAAWAVLIMVAFHSLFVSGLSVGSPGAMASANSEPIHEAIDMYQEGSWRELIAFRWLAEIPSSLLNIPFAAVMVLGMFLLGLFAGKRDLFRDVKKHHRLFRTVQIASLLLSLPTLYVIYGLHQSIVSFPAGVDYAKDTFINLNGITMSLFYMSTLALLLQRPTVQQVLAPLRSFGQMALTNYLAQTVITFGFIRLFGLYGQLALWQGTIIAIVLLPLQMVFSYYWLKSFRFGPLEWIWRMFTYLSIQPLRKRSSAVSE